ncbi:MAG: DUF6879 family protein [Pseudonocardiaceae bacterium]
MEAITFQEFQDIFRTSRRAFHLELRDDYHVEHEEVPFRKWLKGELDDFGWRIEWLSFIKEITTRGVVVERARVVTEPHTDYVRWELTLDPQNIDAGEDIRYLPRRHAEGIVLPAEDCWLFDDDRLVLSLFKPEGGSGGFASEYDPDLIGQYRVVCNQVWSRAVSYAEYAAR